MSDSLKPEAIETVASLHEAGKQIWILTGDNRLCAEAVAAELGISPAQVVAGVKPAGKRKHVLALQRSGQVVCMIGDGAAAVAPMLAAVLTGSSPM